MNLGLAPGDIVPMQLHTESHYDYPNNILWYEGHIKENEYLSTQRFGGWGHTHQQAVEEAREWLANEGYL